VEKAGRKEKFAERVVGSGMGVRKEIAGKARKTTTEEGKKKDEKNSQRDTRPIKNRGRQTTIFIEKRKTETRKKAIRTSILQKKI